MTIRNLLNLTVSLVTLAIVLKAAYYAYLGISVGMRNDAVMILLTASLTLGFALFMFRVIDHYTTKKKRV